MRRSWRIVRSTSGAESNARLDGVLPGPGDALTVVGIASENIVI